MTTTAIAGDQPQGLGGSLPCSKTAMLEEGGVTGRAALKLAAPGERDGQAEGTAAGAPR